MPEMFNVWRKTIGMPELEPADREASAVVNALRDRGILTGTDGPYHNVIKIRPPMCISSNA